MSELAVSAPTVIESAMTSPTHIPWSGSVWIATIDDVEFAAGRQILTGLDGYRTARLLVRSGRFPRGFVELPITRGQLDFDEAITAIDELPAATPRPQTARPAISIVLCTYARPALLAAALQSVLAIDYPVFEVVVVDNDPASGSVAPVIRAIDDPRVSLVLEPGRGLARARNTGALAAAYDLVAFTDDDVCIDTAWLHGIADGFTAGADVACVSGIVPSGEIISASQAYFDNRVSWARNCSADLFSLVADRPAEPLFPFQVGRYGTGANFALRRGTLIQLGGFDEGLGIGSRCGGGEDIDIFLRVLLAGHELAYEPSALVWHRHRADLDSLTVQITNYGTGLGAWLTKFALRPRTLAMMIRRLIPGLTHLRQVTHVDTNVVGLLAEHDRLWRVERRSVLRGPLALAAARLTGGRARPLASGWRRRSRPSLEPRRPGTTLEEA
ncbi:MAG: glycosyl transferase family 2 [Pseudonocardiales bacterium]|nr:glycosyl transferase family 2 [Pseudonocardiales bacterium]